jgi:hypothetical protein
MQASKGWSAALLPYRRCLEGGLIRQAHDKRSAPEVENAKRCCKETEAHPATALQQDEGVKRLKDVDGGWWMVTIIMALRVTLDTRTGVTNNRRKAVHLSAALQQDKGVEGLKDVDGGLVDGHHHRAPVARHVLDALHHDRRRPRVQSCSTDAIKSIFGSHVAMG